MRGRHALYVSALAALLASRGARVWEAHDDAPLRMPRDADVAILESPLPAELRALSNRGVPVIVLAERDVPADALAAAQLGARALLPKNCTLADLSIAIRNATGAGRTPHRPSLTPRQREVLELIVEGLDNTQIASRLGITERTVRAHVSSVLERTGAANRTQAAVAAIQRGWVATLVLTLMLALTMSAGAAGAIRDPVALRAALSREMRSAGGSSGAWVYDGGAGRTVFKWRAAQPRVPASVQKLVTTSTALDRLGPESRFETAVLADGEVARRCARGEPLPARIGRPDLRHECAQQAGRPGRRHRPRADQRPRLRRRELLRQPPRRPGQRLRGLALCRPAVGARVQPRLAAADCARLAAQPRRIHGRAAARIAAPRGR